MANSAGERSLAGTAIESWNRANVEPGGSAVHCTTDDFDEFSKNLNDTFYPAEVEIVGPRRHTAPAQLFATRLKHLTVGRAAFGQDARVDPGELGSYHVNVPVVGEVVSWCGDQHTIATPSRAAVFTPNDHTVLPMWHADAVQVCIKMDRAGVEDELARMLGRPIGGRVRFDLGMDLTTQAGARWLATLELLLATVEDSAGAPHPVILSQIEHLERALISGLLVQQPHSMTEQLYTVSGPRNPRAVQRVLDHMADRPGAQYTIGDLAAVAGVGARQLQNLFQEQFGMSPSAYLRQLRLDGVRATLMEADETTRVSDAAYTWGFNHMGRFAEYYERKFGESPSHTMKTALR